MNWHHLHSTTQNNKMNHLSISKRLREQSQTIAEMQDTIDDLIYERDEAMDEMKELLPQYEHYKRAAEYWEKKYRGALLNQEIPLD